MSYEDTVQQFGITALVKWQRMAQVIEPPYQPHMPPAGQPQLTDVERAMLRGWFQRCGAPAAEDTGCDLEDGGLFTGFDFGGGGDAGGGAVPGAGGG